LSLIRPFDCYLLLVAALIALTRRLNSFRFRRLLSAALGRTAFHLGREKRRRHLEGLKRYFGERVPDCPRTIVADAFRSFWADLFSLAILSREGENLARIPVVGEEWLVAALKAGRGAILWESNAFGMRNLAKQVLSLRGFRMTQVHVAHHLGGIANDGLHRSWVRRKVVQPFFEGCEKPYIEDFIYLPTDSPSLAFSRRLLAALDQNRILCSASDGAVGRQKMAAKLLGRPREFTTGMVSLARSAGAPLLPLFCLPSPEGGFQVIIERPVRLLRTGDRDRDLRDSLQDFAALFETHIARHPGWYRLWRGAGARADSPTGRSSPAPDQGLSADPSRLGS
jgi:lauroyl/myristoyl acyltransferase